MAWLTVDLNHHGFGCLFFWQCSTATGGPFKEGYDGFFFPHCGRKRGFGDLETSTPCDGMFPCSRKFEGQD